MARAGWSSAHISLP